MSPPPQPDTPVKTGLRKYCASFRISGRSVAITRWHIMHLASEGIPAEDDFVA